MLLMNTVKIAYADRFSQLEDTTTHIESIHIRKVNCMNRDGGAYNLPPTYDRILVTCRFCVWLCNMNVIVTGSYRLSIICHGRTYRLTAARDQIVHDWRAHIVSPSSRRYRMFTNQAAFRDSRAFSNHVKGRRRIRSSPSMSVIRQNLNN